LLAAIRHANQLGLTSVTTSGSLELVERLRGLQERDLLTLRFHVWLDGEELAAHLEKGARFNQGDEFVRIAFLKLFVDGTIGSATAAMFAPYRHQPGSSGILIHPVETFNRLVAAAHAQDWAVGVHAIGNRGVHLVLNAVEAAQKQYGVKGLRHRIEHSQFVRDEDLARYARLGVVASMQPTHCTTDLLVVEDRIGRERARQGYRWRSFLRSGAMPAASWFQEEAITLAEALNAYAHGSAVAVHREKDLGRLEKGCLADLTVFAGDIFEIARKDPRGLLDVPVELTVVHGRIVHQRNQKKARDSENL